MNEEATMREYIKLLRVKHYIKNLLVFIPMFFAGEFFRSDKIMRGTVGFISFCLLSSAVYILNDYRDIEKDRNHPKKKYRPLASGKVKPKAAIIVMVICLILSIGISLTFGSIQATICVVLYFVMNVLYSIGLKNKPIIDIVILSSGFVIRVIFGAFVTNIVISKWLYLVITTGSLYMGLGKRRNELKARTDTREVLKYYNGEFLDKNMYVCVALADVFYSLWTLEMSDTRISWTIPFFIIILMSYSLNVEGNSDGDPVDIILHDKVLLLLLIVYAICIFLLLYLI